MNLRRVIWSRPALYWPIAVVRHRRWLFNVNYDLIVDGFPRSANSTTSTGIRLVNPETNVLSHCHIPAFLVWATHIGKPAAVLIRDPLDAVSSWVVFTGCPVGSALDAYFDYYSALVRSLARLQVVRFETATTNLASVVMALNRRFHLDLTAPNNNTEFSDRVFSTVRRVSSPNFNQVSLPELRRQPLLRRVQQDLEHPQYAAQVEAVRRLYLTFVADAV